MFSRHNLRVSELSYDGVITHNNYLTLVLCVILLLFTLIIITERRKILLILRTLFSHRSYALIQREGTLLKDKPTALVLTFDMLTISTFLTMFLSDNFPNVLFKIPFIARVGIIFAVLIVAYFFKYVFYLIYTYMFDRKKDRQQIYQYKFIFITDFAIAIFPFLILLGYTNFFDFFYVIFAILLILFVAWGYRLLKINFNDGKIFNFFLYFCTLEILPWLILLKTAVSI